jgi:hypothetical protein
VAFLQLHAPSFYLHSLPRRTQPSTNWVTGWRPFHINLLVFSSHPEFQLTGSESESLYGWRFTVNQFVLAPSPLRIFFSRLNIISDDRMGLSFTIAAGLCQRIHTRVRVPWDSPPYFTVSDSRLPFLSPLTTRRATVEVFDPASTSESDCHLVPKLRMVTRLLHSPHTSP